MTNRTNHLKNTKNGRIDTYKYGYGKTRFVLNRLTNTFLQVLSYHQVIDIKNRIIFCCDLLLEKHFILCLKLKTVHFFKESIV